MKAKKIKKLVNLHFEYPNAELMVCTKNLYMECGERAFKKGKIYPICVTRNFAYYSEAEGGWHWLTSWHKHFIKLKA